jgi:hypothetical protein
LHDGFVTDPLLISFITCELSVKLIKAKIFTIRVVVVVGLITSGESNCNGRADPSVVAAARNV